ncbi:MAG: hypothetical protein CMJ19_20240 [Phycisphaeraceae bacterium]|nr:hypothetical protein [Phycisphaeraceae bacterium]
MSDRMNFGSAFFLACRNGFECLSEEAQSQMRQSVISHQHTDGLFVGRHDSGDLYYTFFGLMLSAVTHAKINLAACKQSIARIDVSSLDVVHRCVLLRVQRLLKLLTLPKVMRSTAVKNLNLKADRQERKIIASLATLPAASYPQSDPQSPYSQFLRVTLHADFGVTIPHVDLMRYRLASGLYANLPDDTEYAINATASAMFLIDKAQRDITAKALCNLQELDGSFKAVQQAPTGDLLTTGTATFALNQSHLQPSSSIKPYLRTCIRDDGLFAATADDPTGDLEYTVYALIALGGCS